MLPRMDFPIELGFQKREKWKSFSCVRLCNPIDNTVHGILQVRIPEWVAIPFSRGSSQLRDWTQVSHIAGGFFTSWATGKDHYILTVQVLFKSAVMASSEKRKISRSVSEYWPKAPVDMIPRWFVSTTKFGKPAHETKYKMEAIGKFVLMNIKV